MYAASSQFLSGFAHSSVATSHCLDSSTLWPKVLIFSYLTQPLVTRCQVWDLCTTQKEIISVYKDIPQKCFKNFFTMQYIITRKILLMTQFSLKANFARVFFICSRKAWINNCAKKVYLIIKDYTPYIIFMISLGKRNKV